MGEIGLFGAALLIGVWAWIHALTPRKDADVDGEFNRAAEYVKSQAEPGDPVLVRPIWELAGSRAFLPLPVRVYQRPVPELWRGKRRVWVAAAHGAEPPPALRTALSLGEEKAFGSVRIYRFDVRSP
jgi:hypothetical protein